MYSTRHSNSMGEWPVELGRVGNSMGEGVELDGQARGSWNSMGDGVDLDIYIVSCACMQPCMQACMHHGPCTITCTMLFGS